ncbi:MAG: YbjQ family protein [Thermoleophilia bacterium]
MSASDVIVVTTNDIPGHRVVRVHGEVFGLTVRARNLFSNIGASLRTLVGGEARGYTKLLSETRDEAVQRLREAAAEAGCNAVLAMRFDTGDIGEVLNEVAAYGTAVVVVAEQ